MVILRPFSYERIGISLCWFCINSRVVVMNLYVLLETELG